MSVESVKDRSSRSVFKLFVQFLLPMNFLTLWPRRKDKFNFQRQRLSNLAYRYKYV